MKRYVKFVTMLVTVFAMMLCVNACFAAEVEQENDGMREITPVFSATTHAGIKLVEADEDDEVLTVSSFERDDVTYYSLTDLAAITGQSDPSTWEETESKFAKTFRRNQIVAAPCTVIKMDNGAVYEVGSSFLFQDLGDNTVRSFDGDVNKRIENGEVFGSADCVNSLFQGVVVHKGEVNILNKGERMDIIKTMNEKYAGITSNILFTLWVKDREEGYEYVMKNCKSIRICTQAQANNVGGFSGVGAYVLWANRSVMNVTADMLEGKSVMFNAHTFVHEANHCDRTSGQNENTAVPIEIASMIRMGMDEDAVTDRLNDYRAVDKYATGVRAGEKLIEQHFNTK